MLSMSPAGRHDDDLAAVYVSLAKALDRASASRQTLTSLVKRLMQGEVANQNLAASNQSLADISENEQGQVQKQQIDETSNARETNSSWSKVHLR